MPSLNWIQCELESLLSSPWYSSIFSNLNEFRTSSFDRRNKQADDKPYTPASVAWQTAKAIIDHKMLVDPVEVGEIVGPVELYRAHDGASTSTNSAGTLGRCWFSRELMENLWISTAGMGEGRNRKSHFKHLMRACNLVLFEWNAMTQIACMKLSDGSRVAVVSGEGNWGAMMPKGTSRGGGAAEKELYTPIVPHVYRTDNSVGGAHLQSELGCTGNRGQIYLAPLLIDFGLLLYRPDAGNECGYSP